MATHLATLLRAMRNYHLRNLAECFLIDDRFMERFHPPRPPVLRTTMPIVAGLLQHVVQLMEVATSFATTLSRN